MSSHGVCPSLVKKVSGKGTFFLLLTVLLSTTVTDMLISILNICSKEELEEEEEEEDQMVLTPTAETTNQGDESAERRVVIKNKILAVGRMSRVFALLREEAERVSELKSASGTGKLPYGSLASGSEGIKDAIHNFDEARKSDIENERLPPDLIDVDDKEAAAEYLQQQTQMQQDGPGFDGSISHESSSSVPTSPSMGGVPSSPGASSNKGHRRGHSRTSSLGTTATSSPSNRRRSLESTVSMIREALSGEEANEGDQSLEKLSNDLASPMRLSQDG